MSVTQTYSFIPKELLCYLTVVHCQPPQKRKEVFFGLKLTKSLQVFQTAYWQTICKVVSSTNPSSYYVFIAREEVVHLWLVSFKQIKPQFISKDTVLV